MIAATLLALLIVFGGPSSGGRFGELVTTYAKDPMKTVIVDKERRKSALKGLSAIEKDVESFNEHVSNDIKQFNKLIKDYDSKPEDFDTLFSTVLAKHQAELETIWQHRKSMLKYIHTDEWQAIISSAKAKMAEDAEKKK